MEISKKRTGRQRKNRKQLIFYILMLIWPMAQFAVFYIGVNLNSFSLAFRRFDQSTSSFKWVGLDNFKRIWMELTQYTTLSSALINSLIVWFFTIFLGTVLAVFFSYYKYKRFRLHGFFKIILFLPSIRDYASFRYNLCIKRPSIFFSISIVFFHILLTFTAETVSSIPRNCFQICSAAIATIARIHFYIHFLGVSFFSATGQNSLEPKSAQIRIGFNSGHYILLPRELIVHKFPERDWQ